MRGELRRGHLYRRASTPSRRETEGTPERDGDLGDARADDKETQRSRHKAGIVPVARDGRVAGDDGAENLL